MISSIGNKHSTIKRKGFTFLEVMVTVTVLATGIVAIYKTFLLSLDHQRYLTRRLYAGNLIDQKAAQIQGLFWEKGEEIFQGKVPLDENRLQHNQDVSFEIRTFARSIPGLKNALQIDIGIFWLERGRQVRLTRSAYISR